MDEERDTQFFVLHTLFYILFFSSLVVKPSSYRWIFFPPIAFIGCRLFFTAPTSPGLVGTIVATLFNASDYILLTDVQSQLRLVKDHPPITHAPLFARIKWGIQLFLSPRGVGWAHEPKSVLPPHPTLSRTRYVASQTAWLVIYMLMYDIMCIIRLKQFPSIFETEVVHEPWLQRSLATFFYASGTVVNINIFNTLVSIVAVATHVSEPGSWPHIFGRWRDAYTIRKLWGRVWHQLLRRIVSTHGKFVCRILHFKQGTHASSYTQLFIAFAISGLVHTLPGSPIDSRPFFFFIAQAVIITFEDIAIALVSKMGFRSPPKVVGYIWVWCWFVYSIPSWADSMASIGMLEINLPFSFISGIFFGEWKPSG